MKKDEATAQVTVVATAQSTQAQSAEAQASAPGQVKKSETSTSAQTQASQTRASSSTSSTGQLQQSGNASPAVAGMKPSSSTTSPKWTTCGPTGGTSSSATCPSTVGNANAAAKSDASKRYGNGKTAAEIAVSNGASGATLTGPGNSQPHKVSMCGTPSNPSGGVDVHAVKNQSAASCAPTQSRQVITSSVCGSTSVTTITTTSEAALHGKGKHLGKGVASHQVGSTSSSTVVTPTGEVCASVSTPPAQVTTPPGQVMTPPAVVPPATVVTPATAPGTTVAPTTNAGSVAGTQTALSTPKAKHANHGVLGTVARVSGSTLPFTGFPLWPALAAALALIVTGAALRRRGSALTVR